MPRCPRQPPAAPRRRVALATGDVWWHRPCGDRPRRHAQATLAASAIAAPSNVQRVTVAVERPLVRRVVDGEQHELAAAWLDRQQPRRVGVAEGEPRRLAPAATVDDGPAGHRPAVVELPPDRAHARATQRAEVLDAGAHGARLVAVASPTATCRSRLGRRRGEPAHARACRCRRVAFWWCSIPGESGASGSSEIEARNVAHVGGACQPNSATNRGVRSR